MGIDYNGQWKRLKNASWSVISIMEMTGADHKNYKMFCLRIDRVAMWLATIQTERIASLTARRKIEHYQEAAAEVLDRWFRGNQAAPLVPAADAMTALRADLDRIGRMLAEFTTGPPSTTTL